MSTSDFIPLILNRYIIVISGQCSFNSTLADSNYIWWDMYDVGQDLGLYFANSEVSIKYLTSEVRTPSSYATKVSKYHFVHFRGVQSIAVIMILNLLHCYFVNV